MGSDCTVGIDDGYINLRVGAIIMRGSEFLMVGNESHDYVYSVGGRIKFGETAETAVKREVLEETGISMEIDRLGFIHENYYYGDDPRRNGKVIYEISFYFYMKVPEPFEPICRTYTDDHSREQLIWVTADTKRQCFPEFFKTELLHPCGFVKHLVDDDR